MWLLLIGVFSMTLSLIKATLYSIILIPACCLSIVSELEFHFQTGVINQLKPTVQGMASLHLFIAYQGSTLVQEIMREGHCSTSSYITLTDY